MFFWCVPNHNKQLYDTLKNNDLQQHFSKVVRGQQVNASGLYRCLMTSTTDRPNHELAAAVDQALAMPDRQAAARYLEEKGAGLALICRVLAEPARRRAAMTPAPAIPPAPDLLPSA